jgi:hypothetical protein
MSPQKNSAKLDTKEYIVSQEEILSYFQTIR